MKAIILALVCGTACLSCTKSNCISMAEAKMSRPFAAVVEDVYMHGMRGSGSTDYLAAEITLREGNGTLLVIKEPRLTLTQLGFAASLIRGRSYEFPAAISDFESDLKRKKLEQQSRDRVPSPGGI